jgi:hypothetical protein
MAEMILAAACSLSSPKIGSGFEEELLDSKRPENA